MEKDRKIRNANGKLMLLEKPGYGVMVKDGVVVNQEQYNLFIERQKQNSVAPTSSSPELAQKLKNEEAEIMAAKDKRINELEEKVEKVATILDKLAKKLL